MAFRSQADPAEADAIREARVTIEQTWSSRRDGAMQTSAKNNHFETPADRASHFQPSKSASKPIYRISPAVRRFTLASLRLILTLPVLFSINGCAQLHLDPDQELAPTQRPDRAWTPPIFISEANESASKIDQLRRFSDTDNQSPSSTKVYDLPSLVDLALRTSPQTRHAWYTALGPNAELGQSQALNYPKVEVDAEGGYLKLPIQFPGQTLVVRN